MAKNRLPSSYELADFRTIEQWIESGLGGSQFDRFDKVAYLIRLHRDALVESGELVPGRGARPTLLGPDLERSQCVCCAGKPTYPTRAP